MQKFEQGNLDSLCGIYSLINAEKLINKTSTQNSQKLFNSLVKYLDDNHCLFDTLTDGIHPKVMKDLLKNVIQEHIPNIKRPFKGLRKTDLNLFWQQVTIFLKQEKNQVMIMYVL